MTSKPYGHAIVIGSSIAGLTAAYALSKHFNRVTVIERDKRPTDLQEFRKGVPQARHPHVLLLRGQLILEKYFPGISQELVAYGGIPINLGLDTKWFAFGLCRPNFKSSVIVTASSRPLLEGLVYQRLKANPAIEVLEETEALRVLTNEAKTQVTGLQIAPRGQNSGEVRELMADFVVDASGRDSHASEWLEALGYTPPKSTIVNAFPGYATRIYQQSSVELSWKMLYVQPVPPHLTKGIIITPLEGKRWHVTLIGMSADYPPTDEAEFMDYVRNMPTPEAYKAIKDATPLTPIYGYRRAENRFFHYESLPRYLENFAVFGDAVCAFNPVYGQGMSSAAIGSEMLDACLAEQGPSLAGFPARFQKRLAQVAMEPWQLATGEDGRWPNTEGAVPPQGVMKLVSKYVQAVIKSSMANPAITEEFFKVQNMILPPTHLFRPDIMFKVLTSVPKIDSRPQPEPNFTPIKA